MKVKYTLFNAASGSMGGVTAAKNRGGSYMRKRVKPLNPSSKAQQDARSALAAAASNWRGLTNSQRLAWNAYAETITFTNGVGDPAKLSGFQCFSAANSMRKRLGMSDLTDAPTTPGRATFTAPPSVSYDVSAATVTFAIDADDSWLSDDDGALWIQFGQPVSAGVAYYSSPFQIVASKVTAGGITPTSPLVLAVAALPYGAMTPGQNVRCRIATMDPEGRLSPPFETVLTVVA